LSEETGVPKGVLKIIQRYEAFRQIYLNGESNETKLRREFVGPLFRALGWDVDNNQGFSEAYKDVIGEQTIKFRVHDTNTKFIDSAFPSWRSHEVHCRDKKAVLLDYLRYKVSAADPPICLEYETLTQYPRQF